MSKEHRRISVFTKPQSDAQCAKYLRSVNNKYPHGNPANYAIGYVSEWLSQEGYPEASAALLAVVDDPFRFLKAGAT